MMEELNAFLISLDFYPVGRCSCKGRPFRWKRRDGFEVKLYNDHTWQLLQGGILRYGKAETAIAEISEYYQDKLSEGTDLGWTSPDMAD